MATYLKIKPYYVPDDQGYGFANAIYWTVTDLNRGDTEAKLIGNLVNTSVRQIPDENGIPQNVEFISAVLMQFEMIVPQNILDAWGPDSVIDDFVLTYDHLFERE